MESADPIEDDPSQAHNVQDVEAGERESRAEEGRCGSGSRGKAGLAQKG